MENRGTDENVIKNGHPSSLSSPDLSEIQPNIDSKDTSVYELSSSSGHPTLDVTQSTLSKSMSSPTKLYSQETTSDLKLDVQTPDITPDSRDYTGTRFKVRKMESSELQQLSSSRDSISPKSVKKVATSKNPLISPPSQKSIPMNEEIELVKVSGSIGSSRAKRHNSSDEDSVVEGERSNVPLLTGTDEDQGSRGKSPKKCEVRFEDDKVKRLTIEDLGQSPGHSSGTSTLSEGRFNRNCILTCVLSYVGGIVSILLILAFMYVGAQFSDKHSVGKIGNTTVSANDSQGEHFPTLAPLLPTDIGTFSEENDVTTEPSNFNSPKIQFSTEALITDDISPTKGAPNTATTETVSSTESFSVNSEVKRSIGN